MITDYSQAMNFLATAPVFVDKSVQSRDIRKILRHFGDPQNKLNAIHVAGTNGKGSVCSYLNAVLMGCGYTVGLFTSPYLVEFEERIRINNVNINKNEVVNYIDQIAEVSTMYNAQIAQFGYITIMMFLYFADKNVNYAIIEVGLGGLNDPTNICSPILCLITSISLDHTELLGATYEEIALQKAGIIKKNVPIVTANTRKDVLSVIKNAALKNNSILHLVTPENVSSDLDGTAFCFERDNYVVPLLGEYQSENAAIAIKALKILGIAGNDILKHISRAVWNGRLQKISNEPIILIDGAHNPDAAKKLCQFLKKFNKKIVIVCGMAADKDVINAVRYFSEIANKVFTVNINSNRSLKANALLEIFSCYGVKGEVSDSVLCALNSAKQYVKSQLDNSAIIVVCGSLYLVGEVLSLVEDKLEF